MKGERLFYKSFKTLKVKSRKGYIVFGGHWSAA